MTNFDLITTTQLAGRRGVTRQAIVLAVSRGTLEPAVQLPNRMYLFEDEPQQPCQEPRS